MRATLLFAACLSLALFLASNSTAQTSDLYDEATVRDLELTFNQGNWWNLLYLNMASETCIEADLEVDGITYPQVGVRFKGNSSASVYPAQKMPFKIKTDEFVADQKLYGYDTLNLGNSFMDPTFTREVVTYHVLRKYMPAPKSNYVRLWINNEYWGIYVNTEQVSGEFVDEWFESDGGNRYKCDPETSGPPGSGGYATLQWLGSSPSAYYDYYQLKSDPTGTEWVDLVEMIDVLNNRPVTVHWTELAALLNMDRSLWYMAGCNLFCNLDSYIKSGHNYYMYNDPYESRFNPITWDTNESFGNYSEGMSVTQLQQLSPLYNYGSGSYPLITKLLNPSAGIRGRQVYLAHLRDMILNEWDWTNIGGLVQQYQDLIEQDVINDTKKLYSLNYFYQNVTQNVTISMGGPGGRTSCGLKPFVENRRTFLLNQSIINAPYPTITGTTVTPGQPEADEDVTVLASVTVSGATLGGVTAYFRTGPGELYQETDLFDDGLHGDGGAGDDLFGAVIPGQPGGTTVQYFILAQTTAQTVALDPIHGEEAPLAYVHAPAYGGNGVVFNEFLAKNDTGIQDEMGENEDWLELYNTNPFSVDLSDSYLTDNLSDLTKWQIPAGTVLNSGETLFVWTDDDENDGPMHATFKLDADGEVLGLVDSDGSTLLDSLVFGAQEPDISTARLFDGEETWITLMAPTPDELNAPGTTGFRGYSALDSTAHTMSLGATGTPVLNGSITIQLTNGPVSDFTGLLVSLAPEYWNFPFTNTVLLAQPPFLMVMVLITDGTGALNLPALLPGDQALVGVPIYLQFITDVSGSMEGSNGLEMIVGP